jgi:hypothetical protein
MYQSIVVDNTTGAVVIQSTRNDDAGWLDETLQLLQTSHHRRLTSGGSAKEGSDEDFPLLEGHGDSEACASNEVLWLTIPLVLLLFNPLAMMMRVGLMRHCSF